MKISSVFALFVIAFASVVARPGWSEPLKLRLGKDVKALHLPDGRQTTFIEPAFEDYAFMLEDVCKAMKVEHECSKYLPMNGDIGTNAVAVIFRGEPLVVYGRELSTELGYNGALGVIAHEVGHHYCGHLTRQISPHEAELAADVFAGAALRNMRISLKDTLAMTSILDERASPSHPARADRVRALKTGWESPDAAKRCRA